MIEKESNINTKPVNDLLIYEIFILNLEKL